MPARGGSRATASRLFGGAAGGHARDLSKEGRRMGKMWTGRSNGCWVDVFDQENFTGNTRRLQGPAEFPGLRIREKDWGEFRSEERRVGKECRSRNRRGMYKH